jgi:hypothetical protein
MVVQISKSKFMKLKNESLNVLDVYKDITFLEDMIRMNIGYSFTEEFVKSGAKIMLDMNRHDWTAAAIVDGVGRLGIEVKDPIMHNCLRVMLSRMREQITINQTTFEWYLRVRLHIIDLELSNLVIKA